MPLLLEVLGRMLHPERLAIDRLRGGPYTHFRQNLGEDIAGIRGYMPGNADRRGQVRREACRQGLERRETPGGAANHD
jgi:hypothetical protein